MRISDWSSDVCSSDLPVLPLHGPRSTGWRSGDHYLDGDMTDLVYAESQALWDLRRTLAWLRANESGARVGVYGISLGRSEEHTSELQSLMRISYAVFCFKTNT